MRAVSRSSFWRRFFVFKVHYLASIKDLHLRCYVASNICTRDNPSKQTAADRFLDIDQNSLKYLSKKETNYIHDIAVSTGVTSVQFLERIRASGFQAQFFISDKYSIYTYSGKRIIRIYDAQGSLVLGYVYFLLGDNNKNISPFFFASRWLFSLLQKLPKAKTGKEFYLYDERVQVYLARNEIINVNYDVFSTQIISRYTYVRCMNLLNREYFANQEIQRALTNILFSLKEGGVLQIGRTLSNGKNAVSYYRKNADKLTVLEHLNGGSEINELIMRL